MDKQYDYSRHEYFINLVFNPTTLISEANDIDGYFEDGLDTSIPTHWNDNTREELIRPLFMKSGLINEDDDGERLIFFTDLELTFRYLQSEHHYKRSVEMNQGHQYVIMSLDLQQELLVDLELVSAQYPGLKTTDSRFIPQLLKYFHFTIPFGFHDVKSSLITLCDPCLVLHFIDSMLESIKEQFKYRYYDYDKPFETALTPCPFSKFECPSDPQFSKKILDLESIRSLTLEDVFKDCFHFVEKTLMDEINTFLQGTDKIKAGSLIIICKEDKRKSGLIAVLKLVEKWAKAYSEEQDRINVLIANHNCFSYSFFLHNKLKKSGELRLVK
ncbi:uncharacterized protein EV154DRAFT_582433 [Mucor mucedo]|uniref:uncharacterized protein n=1 Tax=Mucor mucedo TaxID=29922 RepID=UPI002220C9A2|nr:uncharacterized protein EV154DRAFT_590284 [Mucor mucedo]XP_051460093.1 uncharacterized protein EV154DRAFT_582433 [Mucor mucedo]KAI7890472.1 hypothetical protein EV154DRAFT_590284 [Mucor mucedo]KAI7893677.1 hypothetical protein EV154DRAFT_582433 [Mucor mucedo]